MGGGGEKKPGQYMGWWGNLASGGQILIPPETGSPTQKGIITYGLSNNRQRALAGTAHSAVFNTARRTRAQILYWAIPMLIGYETMQWATERLTYRDRNEYLNSKAGRAEFGDSE
ncbi:hypothetical protein MBLNU457_6955t2 [Dothideomycetes sp. NU457]